MCSQCFVNPTQFNDKHDLETYPRTLEADCVLLESAGCDYVFAALCRRDVSGARYPYI